MDAYILNYNNYFNRIVRMPDVENLEQYLTGRTFDYVENINFNPGDGVTTTFTMNTSFNGNYFIVAKSDLSIVSRWFITEQKYQRNGQYTLSLRRDLLVDYYDYYIDQPCYIEKATLTSDDPMIFNSENMQFNRIKKSETMLKDSTEIGWIVGYTQPYELAEASIDISGKEEYISVTDITAWEYYDYVTFSTSGSVNKYWHKDSKLYLGGGVNMDTKARYTAGPGTSFQTGLFASGVASIKYWSVKTTAMKAMSATSAFAVLESTKNGYASFRNINGGELSSADFVSLGGQIIRDASTGKFYKITIKELSRKTDTGSITTSAGNLQTNLYNALVEDWGNPTLGHPDSDVNNNSCMYYYETYAPAYIYLEETAEITGDLVIAANAVFLSESTKAHDAEYCIFAIPCPKQGETRYYAGYEYTYEKSMAMAQLLVRQLQPSSAGGNLIDLQLLPYDPTRNGSTVLEKLEYHENSTAGDVTAEAYTIGLSSFSFYIDEQIIISNPKISNECDVYRLVAPNYASSFEFSPAKNGNVLAFHVDCTYKPYTPYINVHPVFGNLYGQDFDDNRGLILTGDYSLPLTSDTFTTYQIQNKNYSNIFDRQMQNVDFNQRWSMANSITGAVAGTMQGAAMGALAGPAGAIAGGLASGIAGGVDIAQNAATYKENKDLQTDMYSYQLGNIDSKPNSLVKNSAFDINFKVWPFIEYCTCTDEEKTALENKMTYNGMTVNRIGTISDFLDNSYFIKGTLIRLGDTGDDSHIANEIYLELEKGAYFE